MTFRERVAAMFFVAPPFEGVKYGAKDSIEEAQILAEACCRAWGHDVPDQATQRHRTDGHGQRQYCKRCGAEPKKTGGSK